MGRDVGKEVRMYGYNETALKTWVRSLSYSPTSEWIACGNKDGLWLFRNSAMLESLSKLEAGKPRSTELRKPVAGAVVADPAADAPADEPAVPDQLRAAAGGETGENAAPQCAPAAAAESQPNLP